MNESAGDGGFEEFSAEELELLSPASESGPNLHYLWEYWSNVKNPESRSRKLTEASSFSHAAFKKA